MLRTTLALIFLLPSALQGQDLSGRLQPVTGLRTFDGYYDVATGRLVRGAQPPPIQFQTGCGDVGSFSGEIVYDNTCTPSSWIPLAAAVSTGGTANEEMGDYGAVPSFTSFSNECTVGCQDSYDIEQFEIAWCSQEGTRQDATVRFWNPPHQACTGTPPTAGAPTFEVSMSGLPRSAQVGVTSCYALTVFLGTPGFELAGSTSFSAGTVPGDKFAWSIRFPSSSGSTGPALAGDLSIAAACAPCEGTIWEIGGQTTGNGTGAGQDGFVFLESYGGTSTATGDCYHFGGEEPSGLFLLLRSSVPCTFGIPACANFCDAIDGSLSACPCAPGDNLSGCASPIPPMQGGGLTGGVSLRALAQTFSPQNRATFESTGYPSGSTPGSVLFRNSSLDPSSPIVFGDGVRCVAANGLVRIGGTAAVNGTAIHTFGHGTMSGTGAFFYQAWYRSLPISYCDPTAGFNTSHGHVINW